jgi:hypothetical protein
MPIWWAWSLAWDIASASCCCWARGALVVLILGLHTALVGLGMLLLDKLLNERQTLAHVLGLGLDFRYRELRLDIHLLELQARECAARCCHSGNGGCPAAE